MTATPVRGRPLAVALGAAALLVGIATGCAPDTEGTAPSPSSPEPIQTQSLSPTGTAAPSRSPSPDAGPEIPADCRGILSADVLAQLGDTPLNDPVFGPSGPQPDGSLTCIWADPGADTTGLTTVISALSRGPALDLLNDLADNEDFACYTPDQGTRCERTYPNPEYRVTDGRTLFWRDDILIDTVYSNLAPEGYTASIVAAIWD